MISIMQNMLQNGPDKGKLKISILDVNNRPIEGAKVVLSITGQPDSVIENFSKSILQQKSEYTFLFNQIKKYIDNSNEDDYIIGHFLRRFLEIFAS